MVALVLMPPAYPQDITGSYLMYEINGSLLTVGTVCGTVSV